MLTLIYAREMTRAGFLGVVLLFAALAYGQDDADTVKPVPILTGSTAYFTRAGGGEIQSAPSASPLLLLPLGDNWLIEAKGSYSDAFAKGEDDDYYQSNSSYGLSYAQIDYIANRYATVVAGRFIAPFGIYGERLAPNWIRALQESPLSESIASGSGLGGMLRGAFPVGTQKVELNYAVYFSTASTNHIVDTSRSTGGRFGFFLPGSRLEIGASFQQLLQSDRFHAAGFHSEWQPNAFPLTFRSEYVHSSGLNGSGYWVESVYRLSRVRYLRRLEIVGRGQQFFADSKLSLELAASLGDPRVSANQGDFGLNYYLGRDVRASASYGRQFALGNNANVWEVGLAYRFLMPLGPKGGAF
jgi:hypothetical protein